MKRIFLNIVCVLSIIVLVILVSIGTLESCFIALVVFLYAFLNAKHYPQVYRNFYKDTMRFVEMFFK